MWSQSRVLLVTFSAVVASTAFFLSSSGQAKSPDTALVGNTIKTPVTVMEVERIPYARQIVSSGTVRPVSEQSLSFKVSGVIDQVLVREGQMVKKGQLLARLALEEIDAQVDKAQVVLTDAKRQLKRIDALKSKQLLSDEQSRQAETAVQVAQNDLRIAKFNRKYAVIKAPADGKILTRHIEPHELVQVGQSAFVFADQSQGWQVQLSVADIDVVNLQIGDLAEVRLDAFASEVFYGKVNEIAGRADLQSQTFAVGVLLEGEPELLSGLIAHTSITPAKTQPLSAIPLTALLRADDDKAKVYVLNDKGEAEVRHIQLAYLEGGNAMVSSGLADKQTIIVEGGPYITDGKAINIVDSVK